MADFIKDFQRILDEEVGDYANRALVQLAAAIQKKGLVLSEDLLRSLQAEVVAASSQYVASMGINFEQYGRIQEMKGIKHTKAPPIKEIEAYVRKVGIEKFAYVPSYGFNSRPVGLGRTINRIAWGIARARLRDNQQAKPRAWFAKTFYSSINNFIDLLTTRYAKATGQHIAASIRF
jgi:hypothetical protein